MLWRQCASSNPIKNAAQFFLYWGTRKRQFLDPWVDSFIALTQFGKSKFISGGLPENKIFVKPNFIEDTNYYYNRTETRHGALFVGRLSEEKGVRTLVEAWHGIDYPLSIVGDGPLKAELRKHSPSNITFHGSLMRTECLGLMAKSAFLVFPSVCYEGFPLSLLESFSVGTPCIATDLGPRHEMVKNYYNGLLYPANDIVSLRDKVRILIENHELREMMGRNARDYYLAHYTPEINYKQLLDIYRTAIKASSSFSIR
jgi:glycosyltransferase involved in cell wall biosynthesis